MGYKLGSEKRGFKNSKDTPIFRRKLETGVLGEANKDGSIFISDKVQPGSALEKRVIGHEMVHAKQMKQGILDYGDNYVRYKGRTFPRKNGKIKYNGTWHEEGSMKFPWEQDAKKGEK